MRPLFRSSSRFWLTLKVTFVSSLIVFILYDSFSDNFICIQKLDAPIRGIPYRRAMTSVGGFSPSPAFFNVGQFSVNLRRTAMCGLIHMSQS